MPSTACFRLGRKPIIRELTELRDPVAYVLSRNLHRRHLDESQRAMIAESIREYRNKQQGERSHSNLNGGPAKHVTTMAEVATEMNVSVGSVHAASIVRKNGSPELIKAVEAGDVAASRAATVVKTVPQAQQLKVTDRELQQQMGHAAFSTTQGYIKYAQEQAAKPYAFKMPAAAQAAVQGLKIVNPGRDGGPEADSGNFAPKMKQA